MKFNESGQIRTLAYTYAAITVGLLVSLVTGSTHVDTRNFWLTALSAYAIVTVFHVFILRKLEDVRFTPAQFLLSMMGMVVAVQNLFALIYLYAADATTYLARNGRPVTDYVDALYFSGVTLLTVGYGDIVPMGDFRFTAVAEVYGGTLFLFAFFSWGLGTMTSRRNPR